MVFVTLEQGTLRGKTEIDNNGCLYYTFLGIPYAKPPIGDLRFKAPQPPEKWSGIRDATKDGSPCYSRHFYTRSIIGSEDCLFLNVYTPQLPNAKDIPLKPVMVYIYGGGFTSGSNSSQMYGPQFLITGDILLVVINYRLGFLGFLAFDDPKLGMPGNAGCKDMVLALKWIQSNIMSFGGDPGNVTIFGNSSGAAAVHLLILSPITKNLFHKAIMQSGSALNPWCVAKPSTLELAQFLGYRYTKEEDLLLYLQNLPVEKVLECQYRVPDKFHASFIRSIGPVVEKFATDEPAFLTENPTDIISNSRYNQIPLVIGYTDKEGLFFEILEKKWGRSQLIHDFETVIPHNFHLEKGSEMSKSIAEKIRTFYFGNKISTSKDKEKICQVHSDSFFIRGIHDSVRQHLISLKKPLFLYRFTIDTSLNFNKRICNINSRGASHTDDLGYLFQTFLTPKDLEPEGTESKSIRNMVTMWTNFARTADPNPVEGAVWKPTTVDEINFFDIGVELRSGVNLEEDRMKFWDDIYNLALNYGRYGCRKKSVL